MSVTLIVHAKKISWNPNTLFCENGKHVKSVADDSKVVCHEIASINSDGKRVRYKMDCHILHRALLVNILLFLILIICYRIEEHRSKQEGVDAVTMYIWEIMNCKSFILKIVRAMISMTKLSLKILILIIF